MQQRNFAGTSQQTQSATAAHRRTAAPGSSTSQRSSSSAGASATMGQEPPLHRLPFNERRGREGAHGLLPRPRATNDDRDEERRRLRLKQGKLLPRDPWGPGEFVSSCALQERPCPKSWAAPPNARAESTKEILRRARRAVRRERFGGSSHKPDAKFGETREAHNFFVDWECRGHAFDRVRCWC